MCAKCKFLVVVVKVNLLALVFLYALRCKLSHILEHFQTNCYDLIYFRNKFG